MAGRRVIDGYVFADPADIDMAENEIKRIKYISSKMNMENAANVLAVYDKLISSGVFVTPVGYEYLRTLQNFLYRSPDINDNDVREIPVAISYTSAVNGRVREREERMEEARSKRTLVKTFRREYLISLAVNVLLVVAVIAMFVITLKADNPNIINYRTAIVNEYSEWESNLKQREDAVRQKEIELKRMEEAE